MVHQKGRPVRRNYFRCKTGGTKRTWFWTQLPSDTNDPRAPKHLWLGSRTFSLDEINTAFDVLDRGEVARSIIRYV